MCVCGLQNLSGIITLCPEATDDFLDVVSMQLPTFYQDTESGQEHVLIRLDHLMQCLLCTPPLPLATVLLWATSSTPTTCTCIPLLVLHFHYLNN